eukprot:GILI01029195.1.p2 GENE.GILI01029195.1~~GILI01029195.1.p2  ORF type:complete len:196 (-),score=42.28 GILI01029195.1:45-632(-)
MKSSRSPQSTSPRAKAKEDNFAFPRGIDPYARNDKGGILLSEAEVKAAFDFFDENQTGKITGAGLRRKLGAFYKNLPAKEYKFLLNNKQDISFDELFALLKDNELANYDPVAEAFKVYDPHGTGFVDQDTLRDIFKNLGYGDLSEEDMAVLIETADADGDKKISLDDFRQLVPLCTEAPDSEHRDDDGQPRPEED